MQLLVVELYNFTLLAGKISLIEYHQELQLIYDDGDHVEQQPEQSAVIKLRIDARHFPLLSRHASECADRAGQRARVGGRVDQLETASQGHQRARVQPGRGRPSGRAGGDAPGRLAALDRRSLVAHALNVPRLGLAGRHLLHGLNRHVVFH